MNFKTSTFIVGMLLAGGSLCADAQQLAFPEAQGWGRYATGGRAGTVYHVTNLNDSGTGSLRDAVSKPNRIVVFDVAGVININSRIVFSNNLYVAGQTAPGEGIVVYGDGVSFSGASNIIVRHMRFRMGKGGSSGKDAAGIANGTDMIFDHCSFSWGLDEVFSINPDGKGTAPQNITLSNCIFGQGLLSHSAGGLMQADNITLYRNFYCCNSTRNNKVKGVQQYVNNIVYNWKNGCYLMGGDSSGSSYVNVTNNLFINGPSGGGNAITSGNADFHIYAEDNWQDRNTNGILDPYEIPRSEYSGGPTFQDAPYDYPALETWKASELVDSLLPQVGATLPYRDLADYYMVGLCLSFGTEGALISSEDQLPIGAPSTWAMAEFAKPTDSDGDGMPDAWETASGTNPNSNDAMTIAANGYANIENYINSIGRDNVTLYLRAPQLMTSAASTSTSITIGWGDYTEGEEGFAVEQLVGQEWTEVARTEAGAQQYTVEGLTAGSRYSFRVRAFKGDVYSEYATLDATTKPEAVEMVDCETFVGDDNNWLIAPTEDTTIELTESTVKAATVVRSNANVTIKGSGSLDGNGSLNKTWDGTLTVETENNYTGQTVLHQGTFAFNTLKDGGQPSAIGASIEYAQNWVWNGGTWSYTGSNTSTNRNAMLYQNTEFNIANNATVTMTGAIEGDGNVTITGKGKLSPASADFFAFNGNVVVADGGTLHLPYVKDIGNGGVTLGNDGVERKLVLAGGNFSVTGINDAGPTYSFPIEVVDETYSTFSIHRNCSIKSKVTGSGTMEYKVPYVREYLSGDWAEFYGTLVANGTGSDSNGSQLMFNFNSGENAGMPNTRVYLKGNTRLIYWPTNGEMWVGGLSGDAGTYLSASSKQTTNAQMIWHIGGANSDEEFRGTIDNKTSSGRDATTNIIKEGSGAWRLYGNNSYKGTTTVNGGSLVVNGANTGTGAYTVTTDAKLAGKGSVAGAVTIGNGGIIEAGDTLVESNNGLTLGRTLSVQSGGIVSVLVDNEKSNILNVTGNVTLANGAILQVNGGIMDVTPYAGTEYQVFAGSLNISGTFAEIQPATPGEGQTWDTSDLYTKGILRVVGGEDDPNVGGDEPDEPVVEEYRKWDFTTWSQTTQDNLEADALDYISEPWPAAGTETSWRRYEKNGGATESDPLRDPYTVYWYGTLIDSPITLEANGKPIAETEGLLFNNVTALNNTVAIAIDYPSTSIGTYAGGSYLWLNGSNIQITIPSVAPGQKITMEVESHRSGEERGVTLTAGGAEIGSFVPDAKTKFETTVPTSLGLTPVDVLATTTKGCHIYYIEVGEEPSVDTGISSISAADGPISGNVYTLSGVLVRQAGQSLSGLAKGLYVIDGRKIVVK